MSRPVAAGDCRLTSLLARTYGLLGIVRLPATGQRDAGASRSTSTTLSPSPRSVGCIIDARGQPETASFSDKPSACSPRGTSGAKSPTGSGPRHRRSRREWPVRNTSGDALRDESDWDVHDNHVTIGPSVPHHRPRKSPRKPRRHPQPHRPFPCDGQRHPAATAAPSARRMRSSQPRARTGD